MSKKIAILQSNYIPWKGYFDIINYVDEFILYDDVQFTKNDWRNRNIIKTPNGPQWITIPVTQSISQKIKDVKTINNLWRKKHFNSLKGNYSKTSFFKDYQNRFEDLYLQNDDDNLSKINYTFIKEINEILNIKTKISWSWDYVLIGDKNERLISLCKQANATEYLSGVAAKDYIDEGLFNNFNIKLSWMDYSNYPIYNQLYPPFNHAVSILDLIFNEGPNASKFMKSF